MTGRRFISSAARQIEVESFDLGPLPDDSILVENEYTAVSIGPEIYGWTHGGDPAGLPRFPRTTGYCSVGRVIESAVREPRESLHPASSVRLPDRPGRCGREIGRLHGRGRHRTPRCPRRFGQTGSSIMIFGLGLVGQLCGQLANLNGGTPVIRIDLDEFRIDKAIHHGCDVGVNPAHVDDLQKAIVDHCPEDGTNIILECTGLPKVYPQTTSLARLGGKFVAVGSPRSSVEMDFLKDIHLREVSILGTHQPKTPDDDHIYYRWTKTRERALVLRLMATGRLPISHLITHTFEPTACQDVYTMLADAPKDVLGILFDWPSES